MKTVIVNLAWIISGRVGGSEEYTTRLLAAVADAKPNDIDLRVTASKNMLESYLWLKPLAARPLYGPMHSRGYRIIVESTQVRWASRHSDLVHHFGGRLPALRTANTVVTIHDLQPLEMPEHFSVAKRRYLKWALKRSVAAASAICTPSSWVANRVVDTFGVSPEKVWVIPSTWSNQPAKSNPDLLARLGEEPLILYPAATHVHKNHLTLLDATERLRDRHPGLTVVLTGGSGTAEIAVTKRLAQINVNVLRLGRVEAPELATLLRRADVLAFPSRYEGFGLPLLEAMHAGTPVVAAHNSAIPEVVGDAAVLVDANDAASWADALDQILSDGALAGRLREAGLAQAQQYAPQISATRLLRVWRELT